MPGGGCPRLVILSRLSWFEKRVEEYRVGVVLDLGEEGNHSEALDGGEHSIFRENDLAPLRWINSCNPRKK